MRKWVHLQRQALGWCYERDSIYVTYTDSDGVMHRKFKKPFKQRPESGDLAKAMIDAAADELHGWYTAYVSGNADMND